MNSQVETESSSINPEHSFTGLSLSRRLFLGVAGLGSAATVGLLAACSSAEKDKGANPTPSDVPLAEVTPRGWDGPTRELPIPPLADAVTSGNTTSVKLVAQTGTSQILPDTDTPTWGFNGPHLGPTVRLNRGENVSLDVVSTLPEETAVHWHGMLLPAKADGGPHSPIRPGTSWSAQFTVDQPGATLWYHPHPHGMTGIQAYRGLAGMLIVDDPEDTKIQEALPHEYGVDDIPLVVMDANFNDDGTLNETIDPNVGLLGAVPYVNGITNPHFAATTRRVRFRILNGSTMRFYNFGLSNNAPFHVVASDSGLLAEPREVTSVMAGPGERVEIVVDLTPGEDVTLKSIGFKDNLGVPVDDSAPDFKLREQLKLLTIKAPQDSAPTVGALPTTLRAQAAEEPDTTGALTRDFVLNTTAINGKEMDMRRVDITMDSAKPEIWKVTNENTDWLHNFHIHNSSFKVQKIEGTDVPVTTEGWKDTVSIPPGATVTLATTFGNYHDNHYPYMYHCHMLFHEDHGMMGQYMIVEKGQQPDLDTEYTRNGGVEIDPTTTHDHSKHHAGSMTMSPTTTAADRW